MTELTKANLIWNRACIGGLSFSLPGDRSLAAMLAFHSAAMNGGVFHALEGFAHEDIEAAELGYRFFDLNDVADFLNAAKLGPANDCDVDTWEVVLDKRYHLFVPDDSVLVQRFELILRRKPANFAPV